MVPAAHEYAAAGFDAAVAVPNMALPHGAPAADGATPAHYYDAEEAYDVSPFQSADEAGTSLSGTDDGDDFVNLPAHAYLDHHFVHHGAFGLAANTAAGGGHAPAALDDHGGYPYAAGGFDASAWAAHAVAAPYGGVLPTVPVAAAEGGGDDDDAASDSGASSSSSAPASPALSGSTSRSSSGVPGLHIGPSQRAAATAKAAAAAAAAAAAVAAGGRGAATAKGRGGAAAGKRGGAAGKAGAAGLPAVTEVIAQKLTDTELVAMDVAEIQRLSGLQLSKAEERALKRLRRRVKNKLSAAHSRAKKRDYVVSLEERIQEVTDENAQLRARIAELEAENRTLRERAQPAAAPAAVSAAVAMPWTENVGQAPRLVRPGGPAGLPLGKRPAGVALMALLLSFGLFFNWTLPSLFGWKASRPLEAGAVVAGGAGADEPPAARGAHAFATGRRLLFFADDADADAVTDTVDAERGIAWADDCIADASAANATTAAAYDHGVAAVTLQLEHLSVGTM